MPHPIQTHAQSKRVPAPLDSADTSGQASDAKLHKAEPTQQFASAPIDLEQYQPLLSSLEHTFLTPNPQPAQTDIAAITTLLLNKQLNYQHLPQSLADNTNFATRLIRQNKKVISLLPIKTLFSEANFSHHLRRQYPLALMLFPNGINKNADVMMHEENFSMHPGETFQLKNPCKEKALALIERLPQLTRQNAVQLMYTILFYTLNDCQTNTQAIQEIKARLTSIWQKLPPELQAPLSVLYPPSTQAPDPSYSPFTLNISDFYQDHRVLVKVRNTTHYIKEMRQYLSDFGVTSFLLIDTFPPHDPSKPSPLSLFQDENTVLFIDQEDLQHQELGLNGLLGKGRCEIQGIAGDIVGRIVLVIDPKYPKKDDWLSRLAFHTDAAMSLRPTKTMPTPKKTSASHHEAQRQDTNIKSDTWVEHDRDKLLTTHYETLQTLSTKKSDPDGPLLIASIEELEGIPEHLLERAQKPYVLAASISPNDKDDSHLITHLPRNDQLSNTIFLIDSAAEVDTVIEHHLSQQGIQADEIDQHLSNCDILVNSKNSTQIYGAVSADKQQPYLLFHGQRRPVRSLHRSALDFKPSDIIGPSYTPLADPALLQALKNAFFNGDAFTNSEPARLLYQGLTDLMTTNSSTLLVEGAPGSGKDLLTEHFFQALKRLDYDNLFYFKINAKFYESPVDRLLAARKKHPSPWIVLHIEESNACSKETWQDLGLLCLKDSKILLFGSQNEAVMGARYRFPSDWDRLRLPELTDEETFLCIRHIAKKYQCDFILNDKTNIQAIVHLHNTVIKYSKNRPNLRQLDHFISLIPKGPHRELPKKALYEAFVRVYGHYLASFKVLSMSFFEDAIREKSLPPSQNSHHSHHSHPYSELNLLRHASTASKSFNDQYGSPPPSSWHGTKSSYLTDDVKGYELYTTKKRKRPSGSHTNKTCHMLAPNQELKLMSYVNSTPFIRPLSENSKTLRSPSLQVRRTEDQCYLMKNTRNKPISIQLEMVQVAMYFSEVQIPFKLTPKPQTLKPEERSLIQQIIQYHTGKNIEDLEQQKAHLAQLLGITTELGAPYTLEQVTHGIFHYFKRFCKSPFVETPLTPLPAPFYRDLFHAGINRSGVCRHQTILEDILCRLYDIQSKPHANERHAFVCIEDRLILDVGYFTNSLIREHYDTLCEQVKQCMAHTHSARQDTRAIDQDALQKAKQLVNMARPESLSLTEIVTLIKKLSPGPLLNSDSLSNPENSALAKQQANAPTAATAKAAPTSKIPPDSLIEALLSGATKPNDLPTLISLQPDIPRQTWLTVCSLKDTDESQQQQDHAMAPTAKKRRLDEPGNTAPTAPCSHQTATEATALKTAALKAIFYQLISQVPSGSINISRFIPDGAPLPTFIGQPVRVNGGHLFRYQKPSLDTRIPIAIQPPSIFNEPYWLLTQKDPVFIEQATQHTQWCQNNKDLLKLCEQDLAVFQETLMEIGIEVSGLIVNR